MYQELKANTNNYSAYTNLKEVLYCQIFLLNRRLPGEVEEIILTTYKSINLQNNVNNEYEGVLTETEKILLRTFHRFVIRGKRGRGVPILVMKEHLDFMLQCPNSFMKDNHFIFHPGGLYSLDEIKSGEFNCNRFPETFGYYSSGVPFLDTRSRTIINIHGTHVKDTLQYLAHD